MLSKIKLKFLGALCILFLFSEAKAQTSASTYSALGVGEFNYSGLTQNQSMGGLGISFGTGWNANVVNPALTTNNTVFNFQAAMNYKKIKADNGSENSDVDGGGISYFAFSLPIKPGKFTTGLGLNQLTSVNYRMLIASFVDNGNARAVNSIKGEGGISEAYLNAGWLVAKNLSLGISFGTGWNANFVNPALTTRNTIFNFQAAMNYKKINADNGSENSNVDGGGISYFAFSLPIKSGKFTTGLGLNQLSSVNYRLLIASLVNNGEFRAVNSVKGDGGISEAYMNFGLLAAKNLSLGLQTSYLFGSTIRTNTLTLFDDNKEVVGTPSEYYERMTVSDISLKFGGHYFFKVSEKSNLHIGAIYQNLGDVNGKAFAKLAASGQAKNLDSDGDLIANDEKGSVYIPNLYGFGVSLERINKFVIGLEGQYQDFGQYRSFLDDATVLKEVIKLGLGFQIVPDYASVDSPLKRSTYRFGLEFQQTPYYLNQTNINDFGINFGTSFPVNQLSLANFAVKIGQRGTTDNGLIRENYVNFTFGLSLNDNSWFYKRVFQ